MAGIIAAADNIIGGRGVAPRATIYGYRLFRPGEGISAVLVQEAQAMIRNMSEVAVSNNSWGPFNNGYVWFAPEVWKMAVERGVKEGYGGKGVFYVWAAGNGHPHSDNANFDGRSNHYAVTAVCAVNYIDHRAYYSELGANLWVCAPSDGRSPRPGITTAANSNGYTKDFGGTSAAAPIVSGVAALLRAANPDLTWRDLKLILAGSARRNNPAHPDWDKGALKYGSDGEHYWFNHEYGFGVVDAGAAADLADGWTSPPGWREISATSHERVEIPDSIPMTSSMPVTSSVTLDPYVDFIEFIAIEPTLSHEHYRDLRIELISPGGAISTLAVSGYTLLLLYSNLEWEEATPRFGSAKHLGEDAAGEWTLRVRDLIRLNSGTLHGWKLTAYGHGFTPGFPEVSHALPGDRAIRVLWRAPDDVGGSAVAGYDLRYARRGTEGNVDASGWTEVTGVWSSGSLFHELDGLVAGARYYVGVRAVNDSGPGPWSESFAAATEVVAPGPPAITGVVGGNGVLLVSWDAPTEDGGSDITSYDVQIYRDEHRRVGGRQLDREDGSVDPGIGIVGLQNHRTRDRHGVRHTGTGGQQCRRRRLVRYAGWGCPWRCRTPRRSTR